MSPASRLPRAERFRQILVRLYVEPQPQSKLREALGISKSWLSELLTEMIKRGLVGRRESFNRTLLFITDKGKKELFRSRLVSKDDVKKILERFLIDKNLSWERNVRIRGINFDFKVLIKKKEVLIKIIDGFMIPDDQTTRQEILELLENKISAIHVRNKVVGIEGIILNLADQKGLLFSLISLATQLKIKIILIICGTHPEKWTNKFTQKMNQLCEKIDFKLLCDIKKRLLSGLKHAPKNLTVIHTNNLSIDQFLNKIKTHLTQ